MNPYTESALEDLGSTHVSYKISKIEKLTDEIYDYDFELPNWREPFRISDDLFPEFLGVSNAINYCFTNFSTGKSFDVSYKGKVYRGSYAMAAGIKRALDEGVPILSADFLSTINLDTIREVFRCASTEMPLMDERVKSLRDVGETLINTDFYTFSKLFSICDYRAFNSGNGIVEKLSWLFKSYRDLTYYKGCVIYFAKRAQLVALMYHGRASDSLSLKNLKDPSSLGPISDYIIPAVLNKMGLIQYSKKLTEVIIAKKVIPQDSEMEIEIRKASVEVMYELLRHINLKRSFYNLESITMAELDYWLWSGIRNFKERIPCHYTYTTAY